MNKRNIFKKMFVFFAVLFATLLAFNTQANATTLSREPAGISMTYYDDIDSRGFAWQTTKEISETKLMYAKEGSNDWITVNGTYEDFAKTEFRCHKAYVTDLAGGTYKYKVGGNGVYSPENTFVIDDQNDNKVKFSYVTDSQETSMSGFENFNKTLKAASVHNPDFIAFAGDLVDNSHAGWGSDMSKIKMEEWLYAFDATKDVTRNIPMMSTAGNHEKAGRTFELHNTIDYAGVAATGGYYSFDYNNLHFVSLDANLYETSDKAAIQAQLDWLENDLSTTTAQWKVVMMHVGVYSTGDHSNDSNTLEIRDVFAPIFAKHKVDLVLQGHDHVYTRTMPYYYGEGENGRIPNRNEKIVYEDGYNWSYEPDGTYYITINYAGTKSYPPVDYDSSRIFPAKSPVNGKSMSQYVKNRMFADVEIDGDRLLLRSFISHDDGTEELYDYIAIKKNTYQSAIDAIDALGDTVTAKDAPKLKVANDLYNDLSDRALLYLTDARIEKIQNLLKTYDLNDGLAAYEAIIAIEKLDTKVYNEEFWNNYRLANEVYLSLSETQKELVTNRDTLVNLKDNISQSYYVEAVQKLIDNIEKAQNKEEARKTAEIAYNLLSEESKKLINNADILKQDFGQEVEEEGCNGSVVPSLIGLLTLGLAMLFIRRKRGGRNEEN